MGYQLFMLTLCAAALLSPYQGKRVVKSVVTSGGLALIQVHTPPDLLQLGGAPTWSGAPPLPLRSAGLCKIRIALGLTGFGDAAARFGGSGPRANPSCRHSAGVGWYDRVA